MDGIAPTARTHFINPDTRRHDMERRKGRFQAFFEAQIKKGKTSKGKTEIADKKGERH